MVITFKSRAAADVLMFGEIAAQLLQIVGKDANAHEGIFTIEQLPAAIDCLQLAIDADRERARQVERTTPDDPDEPAPQGMAAPVSLYQRGWPLLEMFKISLAAKTPVTWGK